MYDAGIRAGHGQTSGANCGALQAMKIDFDGIQAFVLIAELGGFGKAADRLHLTQTALTRRIQKLEGYLGVRLLDRTTRSVHLTAVGRDFLPQAARMVTDMTVAVERLKDMSRLGKGNITLASIPTMAHYALPAVIREYAHRYPGNRIRIVESSAFDVKRAVLNDQAEFGIALELERHAELVEEPVLQEPFMFFCRDEHPLGGRKSVTWKELKQEELIMVSGLSGNRALLDYQLARKRLSLTGSYEVEHLSTAIGLVTAGVGAAILPYSTIQEGTNARVHRIPLVGPVIKRTVVLIRRRGVTLSPAAEIFYRMLAEHLGTAAQPAPRSRASRARGASR
jgi:DNA-binding transcriptional LysR family regulator